jgi:hypothetical protein
MGIRYKNGEGVEKDLRKAYEMLKKAAEAGHPDAADELAKLPVPEALPAINSARTGGNPLAWQMRFAEGSGELRPALAASAQVSLAPRDGPDGAASEVQVEYGSALAHDG